jgi:hypothetical protein
VDQRLRLRARQAVGADPSLAEVTFLKDAAMVIGGLLAYAVMTVMEWIEPWRED